MFPQGPQGQSWRAAVGAGERGPLVRKTNHDVINCSILTKPLTISLGIERIDVMLDLRRLGRRFWPPNRHDIKSGTMFQQPVLFQKDDRRTGNPSLLCQVNTIGGMPWFLGRQRFHLDKHQRFVVQSNQIDFTGRPAFGRRDDPVSLPAQLAGGNHFTTDSNWQRSIKFRPSSILEPTNQSPDNCFPSRQRTV